MSTRWYYSHDTVKNGPFSADQMKAMALSGDILLTDTVWKNDMIQGVLATKVNHLFAIPVGPAPVVIVAAPEPVPESPPEAISPDPNPEPPQSVDSTIPDDPQLAPESTPPVTPTTTPANKPHVRKRRASPLRGVIIVGQDGTYVKFKKKCTTCNHEDTSWNTMTILSGIMKANFFCPKCRKSREVSMQGTQS